MAALVAVQSGGRSSGTTARGFGSALQRQKSRSAYGYVGAYASVTRACTGRVKQLQRHALNELTPGGEAHELGAQVGEEVVVALERAAIV